jgi:translocation protein SEC66
MAQNNQIRERLSEILSTSQSEKEWWEKRKATIQADFMKELDDEKMVKSPTAESSLGGSARGGKPGSDDDAVIVEGGGPAEKAAKAKKKKKGKQ